MCVNKQATFIRKAVSFFTVCSRVRARVCSLFSPGIFILKFSSGEGESPDGKLEMRQLPLLPPPLPRRRMQRQGRNLTLQKVQLDMTVAEDPGNPRRGLPGVVRKGTAGVGFLPKKRAHEQHGKRFILSSHQSPLF